MRYAVILVVLLAGCGSDGTSGESTSKPLPEATAGAASDGESITGMFAGDANLEGGCAWIDDGDTKWQVEWPEGYQVTFDPLTLNGPGGVAASEGDTVTARGTERRDVMTTCQVGPVWAATDVAVGDG
ncbi:MAG: hypothetical protein GEU74_09610 [Nitriliruptorales bacterium]|nr:hypothetical protein [Nitriliruptorales bacterium]